MHYAQAYYLKLILTFCVRVRFLVLLNLLLLCKQFGNVATGTFYLT